VTLGHPKEGNVLPSNFSSTVVGSVVGEPHRTASDHLAADVLLADERALAAEKEGLEQLSIRYSFDLEDDESGEADFRTEGPLRINHVALVESGRAGPTVSLQDGGSMNEKDRDAIAEGVVAAVKKEQPEAQDMKPVIDAAVKEAMAELEDKQAEALGVAISDAKEQEASDAKRTAAERLRRKMRLLDVDSELIEALDRPFSELLEEKVGDQLPKSLSDASDDAKEAFYLGLMKSGRNTRPGPSHVAKLSSDVSDAGEDDIFAPGGSKAYRAYSKRVATDWRPDSAYWSKGD